MRAIPTETKGENGARLKQHLTPRDLAWTVLIMGVLGFAFVPIKLGLREVPPFALAGLRFLFAAIPLVLVIRRPRIPWRYVVAYGFAIGVCQFGLLFLGMELGMPAGLSSLVIQAQVFFTMGFGVALFSERPRPQNTLGAIVAAAGIVVLAIHHLHSGQAVSLTGFLLVIAAALAWSVGLIVGKKAAAAHADDMFALVVWSSLVPPLPLALMAYVFEGGASVWSAVVHAGLITWASVLFMAWGATLLGFASWSKLLHKYPTSLISPFSLLIPVFGLASGTLALGETLAPLQVAGAALVFAGLAVNVYGGRLRAWLA